MHNEGHLTEEVVNVIVPTQWEEHSECGAHYTCSQTPKPRSKGQAEAKPWMHNDSIMQWPTDGGIAIVGHDRQEDTFSRAQPVRDIELDHTPFIAYGFLWSPEVDQELWDNACGKANVQEGEIGEEKIHRSVKVYIHAGNQNDDAIAENRHYIKP